MDTSGVERCRGAGANGYDVYDLYDLGEFFQKGSIRTKFGARQELLSAIKSLHKVGIEVYADIVLNRSSSGEMCRTLAAHFPAGTSA